MQNAMVRVMDPPAALNDSDIVGDEGTVDVLQFGDAEEEAAAISCNIRHLIDNESVPVSEITVLVSKQSNLYCQSLRASFDEHGIPYREEDSAQDLASEPIARLIVDFLLVASGTRQPAAHRRLLDLVVFNHGLDEERDYQLRSRWNRFVGGTRDGIAAAEIDLSHKEDLERVVELLVGVVGHDNLVGLSPDYLHGGRLDQLIAQMVDRSHELLQRGGDIATALASFSGDRAVRIMSVHKSKGLEFDTVFILGVENETFWGEAAAERSVYFVGISRAKKRLLLTVCERRSRPVGATRWSKVRTPHEEFLSYV